MKVFGFAGWSGSGKTTLIERVIPVLVARGLHVALIKHAHHDFDIDHPGKDSHRHREAGAFEVVIASDRRLAKIREFEVRQDPTVHQLIAELYECDWVLVEGFKTADVLKIEIWRAETAKPAQYPNDPFVVAIATDSPERLPHPTGLPLLDLNDADAVTQFLLADPARYEYRSPFDDAYGASADADAGRSARPAAELDPPAG